MNPGKRSGFTIAVLGPDGAGKTSLVRLLSTSGEFPALTVYMGVNPDNIQYSLPTTRWARRHGGLQLQSRAWMGRTISRLLWRFLRSVRQVAGAANQFLEMGYRLGVASTAKRQGKVVLFDRYVYDALVDAMTDGAAPWEWLRARVIARAFPAPDLVLILDAPAETIFARKGEHSPQRIERLRLAYRRLANRLPRVEYLDATQAPEQVLGQALQRIRCLRLHHDS